MEVVSVADWGFHRGSRCLSVIAVIYILGKVGSRSKLDLSRNGVRDSMLRSPSDRNAVRLPTGTAFGIDRIHQSVRARVSVCRPGFPLRAGR